MSPNRMVHHYIRAILGTVVTGLLCSFVLFPVASEALTISPPRVEVQVDPGQTYSGTYVLTNDAETPRTFSSSFENFEAQGETGNPKFVENDEGLAGWLSGPDVLTLGPGESREIPFTVTVPASADPGGYFSAIFWALAPAADASGQVVRLSAKIGTLILLRVNGDISEEGGIIEFDSVDGKRFYTELPVDFYYRFQNGGTDRVLPRGTLSAKNLFGGMRYYNANKTEGNVLPGTVRRFSATWGKPVETESEAGFFPKVKRQWQQFALGPYRIDLDLTYGSVGLSAQERIKVFILPWQLLLTLIIGLGATLIVFVLGIRRYNRWVVKKAQRQLELFQKQGTNAVSTPQEKKKRTAR